MTEPKPQLVDGKAYCDTECPLYTREVDPAVVLDCRWRHPAGGLCPLWYTIAVDKVRARILSAYPTAKSMHSGHIARDILDILEGGTK